MFENDQSIAVSASGHKSASDSAGSIAGVLHHSLHRMLPNFSP
jgi:hypothetical protein